MSWGVLPTKHHNWFFDNWFDTPIKKNSKTCYEVNQACNHEVQNGSVLQVFGPAILKQTIQQIIGTLRNSNGAYAIVPTPSSKVDER